ncbi:hypothetical protein L0Y59_04110, partial [Candidatus Uhrbacteria bacterium]|nr:hypothetical protein [Candidatus Uhrbacteria bacterium]
MATFEHLRTTFFPGKVIRIFFGEPTTRRIMADVLDQTGIDPIDGADIDPEVVPALAAGTYPILVQSFDGFLFDTVVPEDRLRDYLRAHRERPNPLLWASFA